MNRAERRRNEKELAKIKTRVYTMTEEQLSQAIYEGVKKEADKIRDKATNDAINTAFFLMLSIPVMVLHDKWWEKTSAKRCPKFIDQCLDLYDSFGRGDVTLEDLSKCLEEESGIRIERNTNHFSGGKI